MQSNRTTPMLTLPVLYAATVCFCDGLLRNITSTAISTAPHPYFAVHMSITRNFFGILLADAKHGIVSLCSPIARFYGPPRDGEFLEWRKGRYRATTLNHVADGCKYTVPPPRAERFSLRAPSALDWLFSPLICEAEQLTGRQKAMAVESDL